jgi:hypothetical protein
MTAFAVGASAASTARTIPIFSFIAVIFYRIKTNAGRLLFVIQSTWHRASGKSAIDVVTCGTGSRISADDV